MDTHKQLTHLDFVAKNIRYPLVLCVENVKSPDNIGSFFRLSDALGVEKIILNQHCACVQNKRVSRAARSAQKYIACERVDCLEVKINSLKLQGYTVVCLEITSNSQPLGRLQLNKHSKVALIVGSENHGVSPALLNIADHIVHIDMLGRNSSMNVAMAAALGIYEISKDLTPITTEC